MPHCHRLDSCELDLRPGLGRADQLLGTVPPCSLRRDQGTGDRPQPAVESKLADGRMTGERALRDLMRSLEHCQGDGQVEPGPLLAKVGRREVDDDAVTRPGELRRGDSASDSLLRLLAGAIGEPDDREGGSASLEKGLDLDTSRIEADQGMGDGSREDVGKIDDEP
jgi:hypothetical protein